MSTELNVANGIKANLKCPAKSTITVDNINSNSTNCDKGKALDVFINKCVGENSCTVSENDLQCPGNIDVEYRCIGEDGNEVNKAKINASYDSGNGDDFNLDATIANESNLGTVIDNKQNDVTADAQDTNTTSTTTSNSTDSSTSQSSTSNSSNENNEEENNEEEEEDKIFQSYSVMVISLLCLILIGVLLFFGWKLFKKYEIGKSLTANTTNAASASTLSSTSSMADTTVSSAKASSSSIKL